MCIMELVSLERTGSIEPRLYCSNSFLLFKTFDLRTFIMIKQSVILNVRLFQRSTCSYRAAVLLEKDEITEYSKFCYIMIVCSLKPDISSALLALLHTFQISFII
jgi:hypothetical protein